MIKEIFYIKKLINIFTNIKIINYIFLKKNQMEYEIKVINKLTKIDIINFPKILSIK
jgi:hypothetical protein